MKTTCKVEIHTRKDCFVYINKTLSLELLEQQYDRKYNDVNLLKIETSHSKQAPEYVSCKQLSTTAAGYNERGTSTTSTGEVLHTDRIINLSKDLAERLRLVKGDMVLVSVVTSRVPVCVEADVSPLNVDLIVLDLQAKRLESEILNQIRVIHVGLTFPIWIDNIKILLRVGCVTPQGDSVTLGNSTVLNVTPPTDEKTESLIRSDINGRHGNNESGSLIGRTLGKLSDVFNSYIRYGVTDVDPSNGRDLSDANSEIHNTEDNTAESIITHIPHKINITGRVCRLGSPPPHPLSQGSPLPHPLSQGSSPSEPPPSREFFNEIIRGKIQPLLMECLPKRPVNICRYENIDTGSYIMVNSGPSGDIDSGPRGQLPSDWSHQPSTCFIILTRQQLPFSTEDKLKSYKLSEHIYLFPAQLSVLALNFKNSQVGDHRLDHGGVVVSCLLYVCENDWAIQPTGSIRYTQQTLGGVWIWVSGCFCDYYNLVDMSRITLAVLDKTEDLISLNNITVTTPRNWKLSANNLRKWLESVCSVDYPLILPTGGLLAHVTHTDSTGCCISTPAILSHSVKTEDHGLENRYYLICPDIHINMCSNKSQKHIDTLCGLDVEHTQGRKREPILRGFSEYIYTCIDYITTGLGVSSCPSDYRVFTMTTNPPPHQGLLLITGTRGMGKTTIVHNVLANIENVYTEVIDCKQLIGLKIEFIQSKLDLSFNLAEWHQPSVIVLDDLDLLAPLPGEHDLEMSQEAWTSLTICEALRMLIDRDLRERSSVVVIVTATSRSAIHPRLSTTKGRNYFTAVINIEPLTTTQRRDILSSVISEYHQIDDSQLDKVAWVTEGYTPHDIVAIVHRTVQLSIINKSENDEVNITRDLLLDAVSTYQPIHLKNMTLHKPGCLGWDDVGGLRDVKQSLIETLQWPSKYPKLFSHCPIRLRCSILLYGLPGTGKTLLAGVVAKECALNFISIKGPELLSKYIGASEQAVRDLFERAQSARPCIIFFDEFDALAPRRGHDSTGVTDRIVNQLLTQLDGVEKLEGVYVLAATSRPDLIDPALLRPGRFDMSIYCDTPDEKEKVEILEVLSKNILKKLDVDFEEIAERCKHFTGADLKALLYNAQLEAIHETRKSKTSSDKNIETEEISESLMGENDEETERKIINIRLQSNPRSDQISAKPLNITVDTLLKGAASSVEDGQCGKGEGDTITDPGVEEGVKGKKKMRRIILRMDHFNTALDNMRASIGSQERNKYMIIYQRFMKDDVTVSTDSTQQKYTTLA